jgi:hypothetical protein
VFHENLTVGKVEALLDDLASAPDRPAAHPDSL